MARDLKRKPINCSYRVEVLEPRLLLAADWLGGLAPAWSAETEFDLHHSDLNDLLPDPVASDAQSFSRLVLPGPLNLGDVLDLQRTDDGYGEAPLTDAATDTGDNTRHELVVIDAGVDDYDDLVADFENRSGGDTRYDVYVIEAGADGMQAITELLAGYNDLDAIHIVSHGDDAGIQLGDTRLDDATISSYEQPLRDWSAALGEGADLLIYGCNLAGSAAGQALVESLVDLTGFDVAASTDTTGLLGLGGDWDLEYQLGDINSDVAFSAQVQHEWDGLLALFTVNTLNDTVDANPGDGLAIDASGNTSLRAAIMEANALVGDDTIILPIDAYTLLIPGSGEDGAATGDLDITDNLTIAGGGAAGTTIDGNALDRVFEIHGGVTANLSGVTVHGGGNVSLGGGFFVHAGAELVLDKVFVSDNIVAIDSGGGIYNVGTVTLIDSAVTGNAATDSGGGLHNEDQASLVRVTVSGNAAASGGGLYQSFSASGDFSLLNVTVSGNSATSGGGMYVSESITVVNTTFTLNSADFGGGILKTAGAHQVDILNTIVAGNEAFVSNPDVQGDFFSRGYNFIGEDTGSTGFGVGGDQVGNFSLPLDAMLGPLQDNGGFGWTHALLSASTAINGGTASGVPVDDQRGYARDGSPDIGAYEFGANGPPVANDDNYLVGQDTPLIVDALSGLLANDTDPEFDPLTIRLTSGPTNGSLSLNPVGLANLQNVTMDAAIDAFPDWSPDGNTIAFWSIRSGEYDIYTINADGTGEVQLTSSTNNELQPVWSPDGTQILYRSDADGTYDIYVMDADGGNPVRLTTGVISDGATEFDARWSPDGTRIVFVMDIGKPHIWVMDSDGSNAMALTTPAWQDIAPAWSPDGTRIVFVSDRNGSDDIYVMDADGNNVTRLTTDVAVDGAPTWSPDGSKILFHSDRDGDLDIFVMDADGSNVFKLTDNTDNDLRAVWSPDGTRIAFQTDRDGNIEIYVADLVSDGAFSYTPDPGFTGVDIFTYVVSDGTSESAPATVTIAVNDAPDANAGGPYTIDEGDSLDLDASGSTDPETDTLTYEWDLSYDGVTFNVEASGEMPNLGWLALQGLGLGDDGVYTVAVRADDGNGNTSIHQTTLTIANVAPDIIVTGSGTIDAGVTYTLTLTDSDPGADTITSWTINWGDGTIMTYGGDPSTVTHTYANAGFTYNILASAIDEDGTYLQNELLVSSYAAGDSIFRFDGTTGAFLQEFATANGLNDPIEAIIGPDGNLYVTGEASDNVLRYNAVTGAFIDVFVTVGDGGLDSPGGLAFGPDGNLYISSYSTDEVLRYDGATGAFIDVFVTVGSGGLDQAYGLTFGPDGNLYVNSFNKNEVLRYDGSSGAFIDTFVTSGSGGLNKPEQMVFGPDGNLYVSSLGSDEVLRFNGVNGAFMNAFVSAGLGGLDEPAGLTFGPDGNLYVSSFRGDAILRYNGTTGAFIDEYVVAGSGGLVSPTFMHFLPEHQVAVDATNAAPTLTLFTSPVDSTNEDTQLEVSFADLILAGDENDTDGTVDAFVVRSVASGTLLIGTSAGTATLWIAGTNDTIDASNNAYWTPDPDNNGTLDAFEVVARDNGGLESATGVMAQVSVIAVNDMPSFSTLGDQNVLEDSGPHTIAGFATALPGGDADESAQTFSYTVSSDNPGLFLVGPAIDASGTLTYTLNDDVTGTATVTVSVTDSGGTANGGVDTSADQTFDIHVQSATTGVDVVSPATGSTSEDVDLVFSVANGNGITVDDGTTNDPVLRTILRVTNGVLTLASTAGLTSVTGDGTNTVIVIGMESAINAALDGLRYSPTGDYNGAANLKIAVDLQADLLGFYNFAQTGALGHDSSPAGGNDGIPSGSGSLPAPYAVYDAVRDSDVIALDGADDKIVVPGRFGTPTSVTLAAWVNVAAVNNQEVISLGGSISLRLNDTGAGVGVTGFFHDGNNWVHTDSGQFIGGDGWHHVAYTFDDVTNTQVIYIDGVALGTTSYTESINWAHQLNTTIGSHADGTRNWLNGTLDDALIYNRALSAGEIQAIAFDQISDSQEISITIDPVNDMPSFSTLGDQNALEDSGPHTVAGFATALPGGGTDESGQTFSYTVSSDNPGLFLADPAIDASGTLTYTLNPDAVGTATVTVSVTDSGGTANGGVDTSLDQTFDIVVGAVNDAPTFSTLGDQTVLEDSGPQTVVGFATALPGGGTDESGQTFSYTVSSDNPSLFLVGPAIDASGTLTYTLNANLNGTARVTVSVTDSGGTADGGVDTSTDQTFNIIVAAVNDAPTFSTLGDQTVLEDSGPQTVVGFATALPGGGTDESGQTFSYTVSSDNPSLFLVGPAIDASGTLTYTLNANLNGTARVTVSVTDSGGTADGGVDTSTDQTFNIIIGEVNDAPTFSTLGDQNVLEDSGQLTVVGFATALPGGGTDESGQTFSYTVSSDNPGLFLVGPAIDASGTLTYTLNPNAVGITTITVSVTDSGGNANGGVETSADQTFDIIIGAVNDAPTFSTLGDQIVLEDSGPQTVVGFATALPGGGTDESGQTFSYTVSSDNPGLFLVGPAIDASGTLTYTLNADVNGTATVTVSVTDSGGTASGGIDVSPGQTFDIVVVKVDSAPTATNLSQVHFFLEDAATVPLNDITISDSDVGDLITATLTLSDVSTGSLSAGSGNGESYTSATGVWTITGSVAQVNAALSAVAFVPTSDITANASIVTHIEDLSGQGPADGVINLNVTAVNDAPTFSTLGNQNVLEDSGPHTVTGFATALPGGGVDESGQSFTYSVSSDNPGLFLVGPAIDASGTLTYTLNPDAVGSTTVTVSVTDNGGTADGGVDTSVDQTFDIVVGDVNDAPIFSTLGDQNVLEDSGLHTVTGFATALPGGGADESGQTFTYSVSSDNPGLFLVGPAIDASGTLTYTLNTNVNGTATVTVSMTDSGGTTNGGADTTADQVFEINVTPLTDDPLATNLDQVHVYLEDSGPVALHDILVNVGGSSGIVSATLTLSDVGIGSLTTDSGNGEIYTPETGVWTITGTVTQVNAALAAVSFVPALNNDVSTTLHTQVDTVVGSDSIEGLITLGVTPVNDAPSGTDAVFTISGDAVYELTMSNFGYSDPVEGDAALGVEILSLPVSAGTLVNNGAPVSAGDVISAADIEAGQLQLILTDGNDFGSLATLAFKVQDDGGTAAGGIDLDPEANYLTIIVNPVGGSDVDIMPIATDEPALAVAQDEEEADTTELAPEQASPSPLQDSEAETQVENDIEYEEAVGSVVINDVSFRVFQAFSSAVIDTNDEPAVTAPVDPGTPASGADDEARIFVATADDIVQGLDRMRDDVAQDIADSQFVLGRSSAAVLGLSVGYLSWLLRGGVLLSSVLSSLPVWSFVDPLPVFARERDKDSEDGDDESLESIIRSGTKRNSAGENPGQPLSPEPATGLRTTKP